MKKFTCSCFVRIKSIAERNECKKYLANNGYKESEFYNDDDELISGEYLYVWDEWFRETDGYVLDLLNKIYHYRKSVDCGTNIESFKALTIINDSNISTLSEME